MRARWRSRIPRAERPCPSSASRLTISSMRCSRCAGADSIEPTPREERMSPRLLLALVATLVAVPAAAQVSWYGGIAGGRARTDIDAVRGEEGNLTLVDSLRTDFDARDTAWKAF